MSAYMNWVRTARGSVEYASAVAKYTFTAEVAQAMVRLNVSRSELARRLSVKAPYVTRLLRGEVDITFDLAARVAHALGMKWHHRLTDAAHSVPHGESAP